MKDWLISLAVVAGLCILAGLPAALATAMPEWFAWIMVVALLIGIVILAAKAVLHLADRWLK